MHSMNIYYTMYRTVLLKLFRWIEDGMLDTPDLRVRVQCRQIQVPTPIPKVGAGLPAAYRQVGLWMTYYNPFTVGWRMWVVKFFI